MTQEYLDPGRFADMVSAPAPLENQLTYFLYHVWRKLKSAELNSGKPRTASGADLNREKITFLGAGFRRIFAQAGIFG